MKESNKKSGFGLIELAVVIIIIGVVTVIFSTTRELISASETSEYISGFSYFNSAKASFVEKYKALPGDVSKEVADSSFEGNAAKVDECGGIPGNGAIDDLAEQDLFWLQLSYSKTIKQDINFNPCDPSITLREPTRERPAVDSQSSQGFTYIDQVNIYPYVGGQAANPTPKVFLHVLRIGGVTNKNDTQLALGKIPVSTVEAIDTKIDSAKTPLSGRFFVDDNCAVVSPNGASVSINYKHVSSLKCQANLAEIEPNIQMANINLDLPVSSSGGASGGSSSGSIQCEEGFTYVPGKGCVKNVEDTKCPVGQVLVMIEGTGVCETVSTCAPGYTLRNGVCVQTVVNSVCPSGYYMENGKCKIFKCPPGYWRKKMQCILKPVCPAGQHPYLLGNVGVCVTPKVCPQGYVSSDDGKRCIIVCSKGYTIHTDHNGNQTCVPPVTCPTGYSPSSNGQKCLINCPNLYVRLTRPDGTQYCEAPVHCPPGFVRNNRNQCASQCPTNYVWENGVCNQVTQNTQCPTGTTLQNGNCVPDVNHTCDTGYTYDPARGLCVKNSEINGGAIPDAACQQNLKTRLSALGGNTSNINTWNDLVSAFAAVGITNIYQYIIDNNVCTLH